MKARELVLVAFLLLFGLAAFAWADEPPLIPRDVLFGEDHRLHCAAEIITE